MQYSKKVGDIMKTKNINFVVLQFKKNILPAIFILFTICLILFSKTNLSAAKDGLSLWVNSVLPSLFPFFIATELLGYTSVVSNLGKLLSFIMKPLFNVPGEGAFAFLMGIISGTPMGAKIATDFYQKGITTKEESERLLSFTNNSGPLFIIGTVGISLFCDTLSGYLLLFTHILACITVGFLFRFWKYSKNETYIPSTLSYNTKTKSISLGQMLSSSINNSIQTIVMIGGFIVLFSVIISILKQSHVLYLLGTLISPFLNLFGIETSFSTPFITGIFELTNGIKNVSMVVTKNISTSLTLCSFLLGFGGISIGLQVLSIVSKTDLSIAPYFIGKLLQGFFSAIYTFTMIKMFPIFNLDLQSVSTSLVSPIFKQYTSNLPYLSFTILAFILFWIIKCNLLKRKCIKL